MAKKVDAKLWRKLRKQGLKGKELLRVARAEETVPDLPDNAPVPALPVKKVRLAKSKSR